MLQEYLKKHPKKHLIFDFDQTIFTLQLPWDRYVTELTDRLLKLDPSLKEFSHGKSLNDVENEAVRRHDEVAITVRREYSQEFETTYLQGVEEHKDITEFIRQIGEQAEQSGEQAYNLYLWTSNMRSTIEPILIKHSLIQYFGTLVTKSEVILTKPEPEGFYLLFDAENQRKEDFVMIGDSINDKEAAAAAGIDFYSVKDEVNQW